LEHEIDDDEIEELKTSYNFDGYTNINSKDNNFLRFYLILFKLFLIVYNYFI